MVETQIRFGILGCAKVGRKMCRALELAPNTTLYAIGSRSIETASRFSSENFLPSSVKLYGSYEAVLDDPEVDAVYMPLPASLHLKWAVLAAEKKKHVLLEKPGASNVSELEKILEACESNAVQFMDATMFMHHPRTLKMEEFLDGERFGRLQYVFSSFSYKASPEFLESDIRMKPDLTAQGAVGDLGWYCIRAILWANNYQLPKTVVANRNPSLNKSGVILSCGSSFYWEDGKV
ncbi:hypothetical protein Leryth_023952 [Lithospermum erythrorhizon]|nr:hypothetical protein Leryth_023952 [Lithospermum erythrorhizon]